MAAGKAKRSDLFITTKISPGDHPWGKRDKRKCTRSDALAAVKEDLKELNLTQVDLLLHHFPCNTEAGTKAVWQGIQDAHQQGLARAIGVSNYGKSDLDAVLSLGGTAPAVNQCSMSIGNHDDETISYCAEKKITYQSWGPLRRVDLKDHRLQGIATAHSATTAQVALRWITQQKILVATSPGMNTDYVKADLGIFDFDLGDDEMATLSGI